MVLQFVMRIAIEDGVRPIVSASLIISGVLLCILSNGSFKYKFKTKISSSLVQRISFQSGSLSF